MSDAPLDRDGLIAFLDANGIAYQRHDHPPLATVADVHRHIPHLPGEKTKNLFLRDGSGKRHFLVTAAADQRVDLKALAKALGVSRVSFGSERRMMGLLGIAPGAVSLLALINDRKNQVEVAVDSHLWQADALHCHPLVNTSTLILDRVQLGAFLRITGHVAQSVDIPTPESIVSNLPQ